MRAVATSFHHPETAYVSYEQLNAMETWIGVAKTIDSGRLGAGMEGIGTCRSERA